MTTPRRAESMLSPCKISQTWPELLSLIACQYVHGGAPRHFVHGGALAGGRDGVPGRPGGHAGADSIRRCPELAVIILSLMSRAGNVEVQHARPGPTSASAPSWFRARQRPCAAAWDVLPNSRDAPQACWRYGTREAI